MSSLQQTPSGERLHISIFGRRNSGKSSLINALTGQDVAIVSEVAGTTTDPVAKAMEILPLGPVVITDTAGLDDTGALGQKRIEKSMRVLDRTDLAVLVMDSSQQPGEWEDALVKRLADAKIPLIAVANKTDQASPDVWDAWAQSQGLPFVALSALHRTNVEALKGLLISHAPSGFGDTTILDGLVSRGDLVILVTPIDDAAPKGRLILPQVMTIRDVLDRRALSVVVRESELTDALGRLKEPPALVITDSQAFQKVAEDTPPGVRLTSFSILMARYRGDLDMFVQGAQAIDSLHAGSRVLIAEACTHHSQPDDIGKVQIPRSLRKFVGAELEFGFAKGRDFPDDVSSYDLIVHCGGCMLNRREMIWRQHEAAQFGVPMTNYGVALAKVHGILDRALEPFSALSAERAASGSPVSSAPAAL